MGAENLADEMRVGAVALFKGRRKPANLSHIGKYIQARV